MSVLIAEGCMKRSELGPNGRGAHPCENGSARTSNAQSLRHGLLSNMNKSSFPSSTHSVHGMGVHSTARYAKFGRMYAVSGASSVPLVVVTQGQVSGTGVSN